MKRWDSKDVREKGKNKEEKSWKRGGNTKDDKEKC